jgi:hypothetical protein
VTDPLLIPRIAASSATAIHWRPSVVAFVDLARRLS